jgi:hypothetical protein
VEKPRRARSDRRLFSFPDRVNEVSARLVAGGAALMALVTVALDRHWIAVVIAYGFIAPR